MEQVCHKDILKIERKREAGKRYRESHREQVKKRHQEYYQEHREEIRKKSSERYLKNKDVYKERVKRYCEKNLDKVKERQKRWYVENKDRCLKRCQDYYYNNIEKVRMRHKEYANTNKDLYRAYTKKWHAANPEKVALADRRRTLRRYGLTPESYSALVLSQNNKCKICGQEFVGVRGRSSPAIDHCHKTGKIRGILCSKCNITLGGFNDSVEIMEKAVQYLKDTS